MDRPVTLAVITGAHGVTGEIRLKLFGEGVGSLKRFRAFNDSALTLSKLRDDGKGGAIARFAEVTDRNKAEALRGTELTVARSALPPLEEGEYYHADLVGLAAVSDAGDALGKVAGAAFDQAFCEVGKRAARTVHHGHRIGAGAFGAERG